MPILRQLDRRSYQGVIAIKDEPIEAPHAGKMQSGPFKNTDLPKGYNVGNAWRRIFIPTYTSFVSASKDPWNVDDGEAVVAMQKIWDVVYVAGNKGNKIPHKVLANQAVFSVVRSNLMSRNKLTFPYRQINACMSGGEDLVRQHFQL
jgi:hypothetical protein